LDRDVSRETRDRLDLFVSLLLKWSARINLIAERDKERVWTRHVLDSLQLVPLLPTSADRGLDLGAGAGFPGLVLSIATGLPFTLVETDRRKAAFLREVIRQTAAPAQVDCRRIEHIGGSDSPLVTARALAPLPQLLELAYPLLAPGAICLFLKGEAVETELTLAQARWQMDVKRFPSRTAQASTILRITGIARAGVQRP